MGDNDRELHSVLAFLTKLDIKDLVFLLSKSPNRKQFDEIQTVDNLLNSVQTWYGPIAVPSVIYNALIAANQPVLAACVANVCPKEPMSANGQQEVPHKLRQLMFNLAVQFPDSEAPQLQSQLGLQHIPVPKDSLDLMATLLEKKLVSESNLTLLLQLGSLCPTVDFLCQEYAIDNDLVVGMASFDVGGGGRNSRPNNFRRVRAAYPLPGVTAELEFDETHPMSNPICVILNVKYVPECEVRAGSEFDVSRIEKLFKRFNYAILTSQDPDRSRFDRFLQDVISRVNCFDGLVFFIMSHGKDSNIQLADKSEVHYWKDIVLPFLGGCLRDKPKLFFFQCCRGLKLLRAVSVDGPSAAGDGPVQVVNESPDELFVFHATFEGFLSARDDDKGTWFIQTICEKLETLQRLELELLRKLVTKELKNRYGLYRGQFFTQIPCLEKNTLSKNVFLQRS